MFVPLVFGGTDTHRVVTCPTQARAAWSSAHLKGGRYRQACCRRRSRQARRTRLCWARHTNTTCLALARSFCKGLSCGNTSTGRTRLLGVFVRRATPSTCRFVQKKKHKRRLVCVCVYVCVSMYVFAVMLDRDGAVNPRDTRHCHSEHAIGHARVSCPAQQNENAAAETEPTRDVCFHFYHASALLCKPTVRGVCRLPFVGRCSCAVSDLLCVVCTGGDGASV